LGLSFRSIGKITKAKSEISLKQSIKFGKELDRHYIGSRYPNFYRSGAPYKYYTEEIAEKCLNYAGLILKEVGKYSKNRRVQEQGYKGAGSEGHNPFWLLCQKRCK
jgi:HEPN domain-containing protein